MAELVQRVVQIRHSARAVIAELQVVLASAVAGQIVRGVGPRTPASLPLL
jgi:hypothetical protein